MVGSVRASEDRWPDFWLWKLSREIGELRIVLLVSALLYGLFSYVDLWAAPDHAESFRFIRFGIVIPLLGLTWGISFFPVFRNLHQYLLLACFVAGGTGISYMLAVSPQAPGYFGGLLLVLFAGYFLIRLTPRNALVGGMINTGAYALALISYHRGLPLDETIMASFVVAANVIGAIGNLQLHRAQYAMFLQEQEIASKNQQLESQVHEQEERLIRIERAVQAVGDAVVICTADGEVVDANAAFERLISHRLRESGDAFTMRELFPSVDVWQRLKDTVMAGRSWKGEENIFVRDDREAYMLVRADSVPDDGDAGPYMVIVLRDISRRRLADKALAESEARFRLLTDMAPFGIVLSDRQQNTLHVNRTFTELFGYTAEDMPSVEAWWRLAYPDRILQAKARQAWETVYEKAVAGQGGVEPMEFPVTRSDGSTIHTEFRLATNGELNVVTMADVTERRRADERIRYISFHDNLTGLYNRRFLEEEMERLDTERQWPISIIMADLNGLKLTNDTYGHEAGDQLL